MEVRGQFNLNEKKYSLFIEKGIFKIRVYLFEVQEERDILTPIPIKVSISTLKESYEHWLMELKRYLFKKRYKKRSQTRCGSARDSSG